MARHSFLVILGIAVALVLPGACKTSTEEEKILAFIEEIRVAFVEKDMGFIAKHISRDYEDSQGFTQLEAIGIVRRLFIRFQEWEVLVHEPRIQVEGEEARVIVSVKIKVSGTGKKGFLLGSKDEYHPLEVRLRKGGKEYRAVRVSGVQRSRDFPNF